MAIQVYCNCGNPIIVPAALGGRQVKCKVCENTLRVPEAAEEDAKPDPNEQEKLRQSGGYDVVDGAGGAAAKPQDVQLACPSCGAVVSIEDTVCLSCGADLAGGGGGGLPGFLGAVPPQVLLGAVVLLVVTLVGYGGYALWLSGRPGAYTGEGRTLLLRGSFTEAKAAYLKALEYDPKYTPAHLGLARVAISRQPPDMSEIRKFVRRNLIREAEDDAERARFHLGLARASIEDEAWNEAYNDAIDAERLDPTVDKGISSGIKGLATLHMPDQKSESLAFLKTAVANDNKEPAVLAALAEFLREAGQSREALDYAKRAALEAGEFNASYYELEAELYLDLNLVAQARESFLKCLAVNPDNARAHARLSGIYAQEGKRSEALASADQAQQLAPGDPIVLLSVARVQYEAGELERAADTLAKAAEVKQDDWEILEFLGRVLVEQGDLRNGPARLKKAIELRPGDSKVAVRSAETLLEAKAPGQAVSLLQGALEKNPNDYEVLVTLSRALTAQGAKQHAKAIEDSLLKAIKVDSKRIAAYRALSEFYLASGDTEQALARAKEALERERSDKELQLFVARTALEAKEYDYCKALLEDLKKRAPSFFSANEGQPLLDKVDELIFYSGG